MPDYMHTCKRWFFDCLVWESLDPHNIFCDVSDDLWMGTLGPTTGQRLLHWLCSADCALEQGFPGGETMPGAVPCILHHDFLHWVQLRQDRKWLTAPQIYMCLWGWEAENGGLVPAVQVSADLLFSIPWG